MPCARPTWCSRSAPSWARPTRCSSTSKLELAGKVIRIDIEAEQLVRNALPEVAICSDAGLAMRALCEALGDFAPDIDATVERVRALRTELAGMLAPNYRAHGRFLDAVAEALPGVIVAGDSTQPVYGGNLAYEPAGPNSWFNSSTGYGTLGYGLPAAMGAKVACPDRPVVALIGDGGIQFTIGELATGGGARPGAADPALEQPGLRRDQAVHARPQHPHDRRGHLHPRLPDHRARLRLRGGQGGERGASAGGDAQGPRREGADRHRDRRRGRAALVGGSAA